MNQVSTTTRHLALNTPCIRGPGKGNSGGYGQRHYQGRTTYHHRMAYETFIGPIPDGLQIDHLCRNRWCVNAGHLEAVTQQVNIVRGVSFGAINARKSHCINGHPFNAENVQISPNRPTKRRCVICSHEQSRAWRAQQK
jgi:hypothetical protein